MWGVLIPCYYPTTQCPLQIGISRTHNLLIRWTTTCCHTTRITTIGPRCVYEGAANEQDNILPLLVRTVSGWVSIWDTPLLSTGGGCRRATTCMRDHHFLHTSDVLRVGATSYCIPIAYTCYAEWLPVMVSWWTVLYVLGGGYTYTMLLLFPIRVHSNGTTSCYVPCN